MRPAGIKSNINPLTQPRFKDSPRGGELSHSEVSGWRCRFKGLSNGVMLRFCGSRCPFKKKKKKHMGSKNQGEGSLVKEAGCFHHGGDGVEDECKGF